MKRPVVLIVSLAAGAFLVAGAGASAHTIQLLTRSAGTQSSLSSDEAPGALSETPEPAETPEAADNENEAADNDTETGDNEGDNRQGEQHKDGGDHESGGGDD